MLPQLRVATAGSVDDGKSTLIGRLLHDSKSIFEDQLAAVEKASLRYGEGDFNLALLIDGLRAERQQGITIDVAYRYFATDKREFVVADTPGHAEYTRNMVTGASVSDVAIVLVDARKGMTEQTRRHLYISALLGLHTVVLAVNKMDLVDWSEDAFDKSVSQAIRYLEASGFDIPLVPIPLSARDGDNVVERSSKSDWYSGPTLLNLLESIVVDVDSNSEVGTRLVVQWTIPQPNAPRLFAGRLSGGALSVGDEVVVLPSKRHTTVTGIERLGATVRHANTGNAITLHLADDLDVGRGDVIVPADATLPAISDRLTADVCWMIDKSVTIGSRWHVKLGARTVRAEVESIDHRVHIETLEYERAEQLLLNDIGRLVLKLSTPVVADSYDEHAETGRFVLIDEVTNETAAAAIVRVAHSVPHVAHGEPALVS